MIHYVLRGHELQNDVQTMIQVFYPNRHYVRVDEVSAAYPTVVSCMDKEGYVAANLYMEGKKVRKWSMEYEGALEERHKKRFIKRTIYELLKLETGISPQWGLLTGVRPAKIISEFLAEGKSDEACMSYLVNKYLVEEGKAQLALDVAKAEQEILSKNDQDDVSLYIGIPFCPTRCVYCSFTAYPISQYRGRVGDYLAALFLELEYLAAYAKGRSVKSIYIGGGTPTSLDEEQLECLLVKVAELFRVAEIEYTLEAGRPDTLCKGKLQLMKRYGVNRISINPQTMNEQTLKEIGRKHTVEDIRRVFHEARECGHDNINMDLILGLPNETAEDVESTMKEIKCLEPDTITVHTLAVKRASRLKEELEQHTFVLSQEMVKMLDVAARYAKEMGMRPYYMYRQKNMVGNFENVGYCHPGKESVYNIQIMEEKQTILAAGAGASTKVVYPETNKIERIFNVKSVDEYIKRIDEMIERKRAGLPKPKEVEYDSIG